MKQQFLVAGLGLSLLTTACAHPSASPKEVTPRENVDRVEDVAEDSEWKLKSVTGIGETEINNINDDTEASAYRFNFLLGQTAVSCLVIRRSGHGEQFATTGIVDPHLCFINGDVSRPLVPSSPN